MHQNPSPARTIDGLAFILFLAFLSISIPALAAIDNVAVPFSVLLPSAWYLIVMIVNPLRQSSPLDMAEVAAMIDAPRIRLRESDTMPTRALDLGFRKYIIFNTQDLTGYYQDWRALIGHEVAHLENGDARVFHFAGIAGLITATTFVLMSSMFLFYFWMSKQDREIISSGTDWTTIFLPIGLLTTAIFLLFWMRRSLHEREFLADLAGREKCKEAFDDWLRRALRREQRTSANFKSLPSRALKWFTHPSFAKRALVVKASELRDRPVLVSDVFRSIAFLYGSGMLAYFIVVTAGEFLPGHEFESVLTATYFGLAALAVTAGFGAVSVATQAELATGGIRRCLIFVVLVGAANWSAGAVYFAAVLRLGEYEAVTAGLPPPPDQTNSGLLPWFVILANLSVCLLVLNVSAAIFSKRFRYKLVVHLLIGLASVVGGFLLTKIVWRIFS